MKFSGGISVLADDLSKNSPGNRGDAPNTSSYGQTCRYTLTDARIPTSSMGSVRPIGGFLLGSDC